MSFSAGPSSHAGPSSSSASTSAPSSTASGKPDRLFVGNLSPTVDEYTLIQVFSKYGKITKLDFMFHKSGVLKGKPRGYAFVEFSNKDDALKAMVKLHDRLLRGRKLVVTYANSAPINDLPLPTKGRRYTEAPKTTTLSLLKSRRHPQSAAAQIAAMEAKLANMAKTKPADEDYVPGLSAYPLESGSGSASPAPDLPTEDLADLDEEMLGDEEGRKAAEQIQMELEVELAEDGQEQRSLSEGRGTSGSPRTAPLPLHSDRPHASSTTELEVTSLDPPPPIAPIEPSAPPHSSLPSLSGMTNQLPQIPSLEDRARARQEEIKRGLAGLPKRPNF